MVIKYRYAYNLSNQIIDVNKLSRKKETYLKTYRCLGCDGILTPILGEKRRKHFRHKVDLNCSSETYLHKLAKSRFYEIYNECLQNNKPFLIVLNQNRICNYYESDFNYCCNLGNKSETFDLTKYFHEIYMEGREDSFIPDLLLISIKGEKLFIEIAVTHQSSIAKISSNYRIIEIDIKEEDDIAIIENKKISQDKARFYNFKDKVVKDFCNGNCHEQLKPYGFCNIKYDYFVVFQNSKSAIMTITFDEINRLHKTNIIKYGEFVYRSNLDIIRSKEYIKLVIESFVNNRGIKNCFLCRYHGKSYGYEYPIYCKFLKKNCNSNEAAICEYYRPDTEVFPSLDFDN